MEFFKEYDCSPAEALPKVITITGDANNAQAATSTQYVTQTWPLSGPPVLLLLQKLLSDSSAATVG